MNLTALSRKPSWSLLLLCVAFPVIASTSLTRIGLKQTRPLQQVINCPNYVDPWSSQRALSAHDYDVDWQYAHVLRATSHGFPKTSLDPVSNYCTALLFTDDKPKSRIFAECGCIASVCIAAKYVDDCQWIYKGPGSRIDCFKVSAVQQPLITWKH